MKIGVLIGGTGRTLKNLIDLSKDGRLDATIECVVAHKPVSGLEYAVESNIPNACGDGLNIFEYLDFYNVDLAVMGGWIKLLEIPPEWTNRVMNIHPSLMPSFCGKGMYGHHVHDAVIESGVKISGCTVHFVDNEYDHGPIIIQKPVSVYSEDTAEILAARVFEQEKVAYRQAINMFAKGQLAVVGRRVAFRP